MNASNNNPTATVKSVPRLAETAIRPLQPTDIQPLRQLLMETEVFNGDEIDIALELMHTVLNNPNQKDYIIRVYDDGDILGYYCVGPTPATGSTFDLYWIATKPSVHGKGIGRTLIAHAEELIRSKGGTLVIAETSSTPRYDKTRMFYIKAGYQELARIRDYYRAGDSLVVFGKYL
ncbi:MAG: GNAT family N-acetyltransferase [Bacteroidetes bacterium]|nr:GNAT family N-acetyltransferase [Bacteroidota bacterium]MCW5895391.1 GNAT family N-acetyltransferase [Bacteroidota bacterium]